MPEAPRIQYSTFLFFYNWKVKRFEIYCWLLPDNYVYYTFSSYSLYGTTINQFLPAVHCGTFSFTFSSRFFLPKLLMNSLQLHYNLILSPS